MILAMSEKLVILTNLWSISMVKRRAEVQNQCSDDYVSELENKLS